MVSLRAQQQVQALRERLLISGSDENSYTNGPQGQGNGQCVLVLGGTGYIGKALIPELLQRGYTPIVMTRSTAPSQDSPDGVRYITGDVSNAADLRALFTSCTIEAVITLLSSRHPVDRQECYKVDYLSNMNALTAANEHGIKHFIHVSDYGCYRPELLPQMYKLRIEGELIGRHFGSLDYSIVRPTAYFPYIAMNYSDIKHGERSFQ